MISNKVMYFDKRPEHIEKIFAECAKPEIDLCFYAPSWGRKGDLKDVESLLCHGGKVTREIIDQAPNLKLIQSVGIGFDSYDVEYAREKGIYVCNCRDGSSECVAEYDIGMMLALSRRIVQLSELTMKGEWHNWTYRHDTHMLYGKTAGVIGAGGIGRAVLKKTRGMGMKGIYYDVVRMPEELEKELGVEYVDFETLLRTADVVFLLVPLNKSTYHMIGEAEFKLMKDTAIFINDARGQCVDQDALVEALKNHEIWGAALDVVYPEPLPADAPILHLEGVNLIITPHLGSSTVELMRELFRFSCLNALKVLEGGRPENIVNGL